jgi:hypothetical protein
MDFRRPSRSEIANVSAREVNSSKKMERADRGATRQLQLATLDSWAYEVLMTIEYTLENPFLPGLSSLLLGGLVAD